MATPGGGKKNKKKSKGTTITLNSFLGESTSVIAKPPTTSWADDDDLGPLDLAEEYGGPPKQQIDLSKLPSAPRATRGVDIDFSKLPSKPPYTAFLGNLPFETSEEDIVHLFRGLRVENIRFPQGNGKNKGFGYAEFNDIDQLKAALALSGETLRGRPIRIDIAGKDQREPGSGFSRSGFGQIDDRTDGDWRRGGDDPPPPQRDDRRGPRDDMDGRPPRPMGAADLDDCWRRDEPVSDQSSNAWGNRGGRGDDGPWGRRDGPRSRYENGPRDAGFRDGPRDSPRDGGWRDGPRDSGFRDSPRDEPRDGGWRDGPRDSGFRDDPRDGPRGRNDYGHRDGGFREGQRDGYRGRDNYGPRDGGWRDGTRDGGFRDGPRDGYRDRGFRDGPRDGPRDRDDYGLRGQNDRFEDNTSDNWRSDCAAPAERKEPEQQPQEKERPKLNLKPRTVETNQEKTPTTSIFGGARPVDTAIKDRQIEERLQKSPSREQNRDQSRDRPSRDRPREQQTDQSRGRGRSSEKKRNDGKKNRDKDGNIIPLKYEEPAKVVFGQSSKFALLVDDDDDDNEQDEENERAPKE